MTEKEVISASIDKSLYDIVKSKETVNLSSLINRLLGNYFAHHNGEDKSVLKARLDNLSKRRKEVKNELDEIESTMMHMEEKLDEIDEEKSEFIEEVGRLLKNHSPEEVRTRFKSYLLRNFGVTEEELVAELGESEEELMKCDVCGVLVDFWVSFEGEKLCPDCYEEESGKKAPRFKEVSE